MNLVISPTSDHFQIARFNSFFPDDFYPLTHRNLRDGYWWFAHDLDDSVTEPVGFCGMVRFRPFGGYWYFKRAAVLSRCQGNGLQRRFMQVREDWAQALGAVALISECKTKNVHSITNHLKHGFELFEPERPWAEEPSLYWIKKLT